MPLKPLQYPNPGPGSFRERSIFQVPVASPSYRGRVISPDLVPFPMDLKPLQSFESGATKGHPEPLQGFQVGDGEGVNLRSLRSHSPGLCPGRDWNPGPLKDPTARAVGFNHCPGRSGQRLEDIFGSLSSSMCLEISIRFQKY